MKTCCALAAALLGCFAAVGEPIDVWLDVDPAIGQDESEVDDGLALIQAFHSPELAIHGVSLVYGNTTLEEAIPIGRDVVERFGPDGLEVHIGAASKDDLGKETPAVTAMAQALRKKPLVILALGPVTNVGSLLKLHPDVAPRIQSVVVVAGRRPGQQFKPVPTSDRAASDFNFEHDPEAMQVILDADVPFVMAPWEVSSKVWLMREDMNRLRGTTPSGDWLAENTQTWIDRWERGYGVAGFNPFDTLAIAWLTHPELIESSPVAVWIEEGPDDTEPGKTKPYLHVDADKEDGRRAVYCHTPEPGFKPMLLERLMGPGKVAATH